MGALRLRHYNNCPRCPVIGADNIPGEEFFELHSLRFNLQIARELCRPSMLHRVDHTALRDWLGHVRLTESHIDHLPEGLGPGLMATLPNLGRPLIDGNHRAARALRDGSEFIVYLLPEDTTLELLRRSMGRLTADHYWDRMRRGTSSIN
ncbi:MAG: hypothetical protein J0G35_06085 [Acidobacteriales bacterium]|nr:hypothetical protein [Terriglobales bacterium]